MVTPALDQISRDFGVPKSESFTRMLFMTIFMLGYAQGPFVLAPLSEIFGRVCVLQYANLVYLMFNTACGFAQTRDQMLVFRFLSGIGGSAPQAVSREYVSAWTWGLKLTLPSHSYAMACWLMSGAKKSVVSVSPSTACSPSSGPAWRPL